MRFGGGYDDAAVHASIGKTGGTIVIGGTGAGDDLILRATSHATDGDIIFQSDPTTEVGRITSAGSLVIGSVGAAAGWESIRMRRDSATQEAYCRIENQTNGTGAQSYFTATGYGGGAQTHTTALGSANTGYTTDSFGITAGSGFLRSSGTVLHLACYDYMYLSRAGASTMVIAPGTPPLIIFGGSTSGISGGGERVCFAYTQHAYAPLQSYNFNVGNNVTGAVADAYNCSWDMFPGYRSAAAQTVDRHNYLNLRNPALVTTVLTDAAVFRFDAAAGTHKAVAAASTKTTPGGVDAWMKININGTLHYMPAYLSMTA